MSNEPNPETSKLTDSGQTSPAKPSVPAGVPQDSAQESSLKPNQPSSVDSAQSEQQLVSGDPEKRRWGVLVKSEIVAQNLIRVPDSSRQDERCYQPASYDLRLGSEYVTPSNDGQLLVSTCETSGMLTIPPFATCIVSTYEFVSLPSNVVGRFNLRIQHALEGLMVQMGTQVEPGYDGRLFALLHNISDRPKTLKFRDFDTRPFTIEFSYTSQSADPPEPRKKQKKTFSDFIPPNYARGGLNLVLKNIQEVQTRNTSLSEQLSGNKMIAFTGVALVLIVATATIFIPWTLGKFTYDKHDVPLVNADAIAAMKYGPNHSNEQEIVKEVLRQLDARSTAPAIIPREQFYADRLEQLKARRESIKQEPTRTAELKSIEKQINEIVELLRK